MRDLNLCTVFNIIILNEGNLIMFNKNKNKNYVLQVSKKF